MSSTDSRGTTVNFPAAQNFRIGIELEFPFSNKRWSVLLEPAYQRYTAHEPIYLKYRSVEVPIGVRRYFSLNTNSGLFVDVAAIADFPTTFDMELAPNLFFHATSVSTNFFIGGGLSFARFTIAYRHYTRRRNKDDFGSFTFNYQKQSVIVGFRIF
jgi:hypothetical protein